MGATTSESLKAAKLQALDHPKTKHKKRFKHVTWQPLIFRCLLKFKSCLELIEWLSYMSIYCHLLYVVYNYSSLINIGSKRDCFGHFEAPIPNSLGLTKRQCDPHGPGPSSISISRLFGRSLVILLVNFAHTQLGVPLLRTRFSRKKKLSRAELLRCTDKCRCSKESHGFLCWQASYTPGFWLIPGFKSDFVVFKTQQNHLKTPKKYHWFPANHF